MLFAMFLSDNTAPMHPDVNKAGFNANAKGGPPYGDDEYTQQLQRVVSDIFGREAFVLPVETGTAANCLAFRTLAAGRNGIVVSGQDVHTATHEGMAPELLGGVKIHQIIADPGTGVTRYSIAIHSKFNSSHDQRRATVNRMLVPENVHEFLDSRQAVDKRHGAPIVGISISQADEQGRVYEPEEVTALAKVAKEQGLFFHIDGARIANALTLDTVLDQNKAIQRLREQTQDVDSICIGGAKNGCPGADAIVFFDRSQFEVFQDHAKNFGHMPADLYAKSAKLLAYFEGGLWLKNAHHANRMAALLRDGISQNEADNAVVANQVFVGLSGDAVEAIIADNPAYEPYGWMNGDRFEWLEGDICRFVTSWNTEEEHVLRLAELVRTNSRLLFHTHHPGLCVNDGDLKAAGYTDPSPAAEPRQSLVAEYS